MSLINTQVGSKLVSDLLCGAQLDTIRVYSLLIQMSFIRTGAAEGLPDEIWVSVSGNLCVEEPSSKAGDLKLAGDFFERRALALSAIYLLIGKDVTAACVSESGALQIALGGKNLSAEADDNNLEEVWAVMSGSLDATTDHRWYVSLDDSGVLSARIPT